MCCLYGLIDHNHTLTARQKEQIISALSAAAEARGTDATGIAYNSRGRLCIYKRPWPARAMRFRIPQDASVIMGHTRMTTQGSAKRNYNNHPFLGHTANHTFTLAHNGILFNDQELRETLELPRTRIRTDSYIAVQLLEQKKTLDLDSLRYMAEQVRGSFVFTVLDDADSLYFVKGNNPLCLWYFKSLGIYLYASTEEILKRAVQGLGFLQAKHKATVLQEGDVLKIDRDGVLTWGTFRNSYESWFLSLRRSCGAGSRTHMNALKSVAAFFGYCPEDIEILHDQGLTTDEIEEYLYCGEL